MTLLDYTSEVEVKGVRNSQILIGELHWQRTRATMLPEAAQSFKALTYCQVEHILSLTFEVKAAHLLACAGPVDGPAIFEDVVDSHIAVVAQQFQAKNCHNVEFGE